MRISDWSSDVCSSDLSRRSCPVLHRRLGAAAQHDVEAVAEREAGLGEREVELRDEAVAGAFRGCEEDRVEREQRVAGEVHLRHQARSEEHTSELQSLMRISYAVFCLKKKIRKQETQKQ